MTFNGGAGSVALFVRQLEGQAEARGGHLVDATVGSGAGDVLKGSVLVMVAGKPQARVLAEPVLGELADRPEVVGDRAGWVNAAVKAPH